MKFWVSTSLLFLLTINLKAQNNSKLAPDSAIENFIEKFPQEKVFLQTDKSTYFPGETIWMKAWCLLDNAPTFLSRVLYVDMVDARGTVVLKKMYKLDSLGSTPADFEIPQSLSTGTYAINAYTLWMLNFPDYIFKKNIIIYGSDYGTKNKSTLKKDRPYRLLFFPEGGDIIAGVTNRIAFKCIDENGMPVRLKGIIQDNNGQKITDLLTEHDGMGLVEFTAKPGNIYTAIVTNPMEGSKTKTFELPKMKEEGVALKVENNNPSRLFVLLNRAEKNKEKYDQLKVIAQINYQIIFSADLNMNEGQSAVSIPKKNLPPGILQITLFDKNNLPIAERITFIENYDLTKPSIAVEVKNLSPRSKNQISFRLPDTHKPTTLSCIVTSFGTADTTNSYEENIASALFVTSDIKGYIHNPGYYFKDKSAVTLHHLDLLLMTQGWRRFNWTKIINNELAELKYPVESAISFRGTVFKSGSKEVIKDGKVSFIIKGSDSTSILAEAKVTDKGEFLLNNINYKKSAAVAYMGTNNKKENFIVDVKLVPNYIDSLKKSFSGPSINLDTMDRNSQAALPMHLRQGFESMDQKSTTVLDNIIIKAKKRSPEDSLNTEYASGVFLMGKTINPSEFNNYRTIWQMIQASVPGITVEGNPFDPEVTMNRFAALGGASSTANVSESSDESLSQSIVMETSGIAYFLNEINVSKDIINTLSVDDIALIKVLKNEATALGASQGAIAIYTKNGISVGASIYDKTYTKETLQGYAITKVFFQPDYTLGLPSDEKDNRYTLYWQGNLTPSKDGQFRFQFYNNDFGTKAKILIQGIDSSGQLFYTEQIIK